MRIGLDFDNTIVNYDSLFLKVALEQGLVPPDTPASKVAVRDHLRRVCREDVWTEMQGYVYGARMDEATAYSGAIEFMSWAQEAGHELAVISHKTQYPFRGPEYDLHAAARAWIERHLCLKNCRLVPDSSVFFELTKEDKLARIESFRCEVFLDDLPEILFAAAFPVSTRRVLFDPDGYHSKGLPEKAAIARSWADFARHLQPFPCRPI